MTVMLLLRVAPMNLDQAPPLLTNPSDDNDDDDDDDEGIGGCGDGYCDDKVDSDDDDTDDEDGDSDDVGGNGSYLVDPMAYNGPFFPHQSSVLNRSWRLQTIFLK